MPNIIVKIAIKNKILVMAILCLTVAAAVAGSVTAQSDKQYLPVPAGTVFTRDVKYFSESGNHYLVFQADGNLVVYDKGGRFTWGVNSVSDKFRQAAKAEFRQNGSFGLFDAKGTSVWSPPVSAAFLTIRDNGSLQLIAKDGSAVWTSDVAATVKLPADASALDLKANLVGTWSGNPRLIISQDKITAEENGQVKWSGKYTIAGKDTIAITYNDGRKVNAEMIVSERQQGPKLVKRLRWNVNNEMGGSNQWESANTQVKAAENRNNAVAVSTSAPGELVTLIDKMAGTWVIDDRTIQKNIPKGFTVILGKDGRFATFTKERKLFRSELYRIVDKKCIEVFFESVVHKDSRCVVFGDNEMRWVHPSDGGNMNTQIVFRLQSRSTEINIGDSLGEKVVGFWGGVAGTNSAKDAITATGESAERIWWTVGSRNYLLIKVVNESNLFYQCECYETPSESRLRELDKIKLSVDGDTMTVTDDWGDQKKYERLKSFDAAKRFTVN